VCNKAQLVVSFCQQSLLVARTMCLKKTIRRIAVNEAANSTAPEFKVAAVIHRGKRIYVKSVNVPYKTHPNGSGIYTTCHAEVLAIMKAKNIIGDLAGMSIFVARISPLGEIKPSKPCPDCMNLILKNDLIPAWT